MTARQITPPKNLAVDLALAKTQLGFTGTDMDALVTAWVEGVTSYAEHYMQRAIINQTWRVTLDSFPDSIKLCRAPFIEISTFKYYDANGAEQRLRSPDYMVDSESEPGYIHPAPGKQWPAAQTGRFNAVTVEFVCGYGATHASVPKDIKAYILAKLDEQYGSESKPDQIKASFIDGLLDGKKVWGI